MRGTAAKEAVRAAFAQVEQVHRLMNCHEADSDIGRFNAAAVDQPIEMDACTLAVLALAARLQVESEGAFDCAWGEAPPCREPAWIIEGTTIRKTRPLCVNLGGIAKGYAVDRAAQAMAGFDIDHALVNAGGDMRHTGTAPAVVALREPGAPARTAMLWQLDNAALASSSVGGLRPGPDTPPRIGDRRASSILPAGAGASVLAPSCTLADALTKVVLVCGAPHHPMLARYGARTLLYRDGRPDERDDC